jgi:hypothetical protein
VYDDAVSGALRNRSGGVAAALKRACIDSGQREFPAHMTTGLVRLPASYPGKRTVRGSMPEAFAIGLDLTVSNQ